MNILIQRTGQQYGPYPVALAQQYLAQGKLLSQDLARDASAVAAPWIALAVLLAQIGTHPPTSGGFNPFSQALQNLKSFDLQLLFPWKEVTSSRQFQDRRFIVLAAIGLAPLLALALAPGAFFGYWAIALYFSSLWALFLYCLFKTPQVLPQTSVLCFFFTGMISITGLLILQQIFPWTVLYAFAASQNSLLRATGMFLGVGIHEELVKAAILFCLVRRPGSLLIPQTVVFYGMMSGLGFGIYEGVTYQRTINREQMVDVAYFLDVIRLTSLPFLHAIWTGIAGYFISFAALVPGKRYGLWIVAILIPAILHGFYDTMGPNIFGLGIALLSVLLLIIYLSNCRRMQSHLSPP